MRSGSSGILLGSMFLRSHGTSKTAEAGQAPLAATRAELGDRGNDLEFIEKMRFESSDPAEGLLASPVDGTKGPSL